MKTLELPIKKEWFDLIANGEKKQEYREIKAHWISRIIDFSNNPWEGKGEAEPLPNQFSEALHDGKSLQDALAIYSANMEHFDTITLRNGYAKKSPVMVVELKSIEVGPGKPEWGAEAGERYIIFNLGKVVTNLTAPAPDNR